MIETLKFFKWSVAAAVAALVAGYLYGGIHAMLLVLVLIALEGSISFDNAVVNAGVLRRMSERWQKAFLTIGIVIAVFGMRVIFPIAIVAVATKLGLFEVAELSVTDKEAYAENVEKAAPIIGAFGGTFLLMVALDYFLDEERDVHWLGPIERRLAQAATLPGLSTAISASVLIAVSQIVEAEKEVLLAGLVALVVFLGVHGFSEALAARQEAGDGKATGGAGLAAFLYLEMLDASFSLDGVLGAFAISTDIVVIALGLGVGAVFIRSLTVYLVRRETLSEYRYLKSGAHWAIGALAVILFTSIQVHVPEWLTSLLGLGFISAALVSSILHNRRGTGG